MTSCRTSLSMRTGGCPTTCPTIAQPASARPNGCSWLWRRLWQQAVQRCWHWRRPLVSLPSSCGGALTNVYQAAGLEQRLGQRRATGLCFSLFVQFAGLPSPFVRFVAWPLAVCPICTASVANRRFSEPSVGATAATTSTAMVPMVGATAATTMMFFASRPDLQ